MALLKDMRVVVSLGRIAFDGLLAHEQREGAREVRAEYLFGHGNEFTMPSGLKAITSYHPSLQNTNTGKLTKLMFLRIFLRAREMAGLK